MLARWMKSFSRLLGLVRAEVEFVGRLLEEENVQVRRDAPPFVSEHRSAERYGDFAVDFEADVVEEQTA